jgi:hypothetical protein
LCIAICLGGQLPETTHQDEAVPEIIHDLNYSIMDRKYYPFRLKVNKNGWLLEGAAHYLIPHPPGA